MTLQFKFVHLSVYIFVFHQRFPLYDTYTTYTMSMKYVQNNECVVIIALFIQHLLRSW